jgi:hypothetical protein
MYLIYVLAEHVYFSFGTLVLSIVFCNRPCTNQHPLNIVKQNLIILSLATVSTLNHFIDPISAVEGRWGGRKPVQVIGVGGPEGGPWSHYVAYVLVFLGSIIICRLYRLTLSDKAIVTLQLTILSVRFSVKTFSWPVHAGGTPKFLSPGPEPDLGESEFDRVYYSLRKTLWNHTECNYVWPLRKKFKLQYPTYWRICISLSLTFLSSRFRSYPQLPDSTSDSYSLTLLLRTGYKMYPGVQFSWKILAGTE